jgi:2-phospho-L-lactate guanylyltransferase
VKTVAVVPVKALAEAKSRLANMMSPEQRAALALEMLRHVLNVITRSGVVDQIAVVGPTAEGLNLPPNVIHVKQTIPGLNHALGQGKEWAIARGVDALLVVLGDLPLLTPDDLASIVQLGSDSGTVVLAPDRHNAGTNIMLAHPASLARFAFGIDSYPKHIKLHREAGATVETYISPGTALDMDTPADLFLLEHRSMAII